MTELILREPSALIMDPREVAARAHQLEAIVTLSATAGVRPEWKNEVRVQKRPPTSVYNCCITPC